MAWRELTLAASAVRTDTAGTNGDTIAVDPWTRAQLLCAFTAKGTDVGDTCDVYVDVSPDGGTTWLNAVHFTQALGNGMDAASEVAMMPPTVFGTAFRARWVIVDSGTNDASFTFSVKAFLQ